MLSPNFLSIAKELVKTLAFIENNIYNVYDIYDT